MSADFSIQALEAFAARLPKAARILCADSQAQTWLGARGFAVESLPPEKDLRLLNLKTSSFEGIWVGSRLSAFPLEDVQRVIATFFKALQPEIGLFSAAHSFGEAAFASLLRQNGFHIRLQGQCPPWHAVVSQRI